ncbi:asparagine synthase, partial [Amycolatopsis magusensis]|nr:asparagine synthase [Amycolatopsis magusensis]
MELLIFPDSPAAGELAADRGAARVLTHASGRPWVVGAWTDEELTLITAGARRLAVFGRTRIDTERTTRVLGRARSPHDLDAVARELPGGVHLTASFDGRVRSQGTVSTSRQIFFAEVGGVTVAADNPGPLAVLAKAPLDEETLALKLMVPAPPWPLSLRTPWRGVDQLPVGHWLDLAPDGRGHAVRWWRPPAADQPL